MKEIISLIQQKFNLWLEIQKRHFSALFWQNKYKIALLLVLIYFAHQQNYNFALPQGAYADYEVKHHEARDEKASFIDMSGVIDFIKGDRKEKPLAKTVAQKTKTIKSDPSLGNDYSNVSFWGGRKDGTSKRSEKRQIQDAYIQRFGKIAQTEAEKFGIPASIIMAQGILESNAGGSRLATNNNNHFGIKCFSRNCRKGHCTNFTDDSHKDFFKKYESPWQSYRDHSHLLKKFHYRRLFKNSRKDYRAWAEGLQRLGYATDKHYAESLIRTIEDLNLDKLD